MNKTLMNRLERLAARQKNKNGAEVIRLIEISEVDEHGEEQPLERWHLTNEKTLVEYWNGETWSRANDES
jgi:hypothetical protein